MKTTSQTFTSIQLSTKGGWVSLYPENGADEIKVGGIVKMQKTGWIEGFME